MNTMEDVKIIKEIKFPSDFKNIHLVESFIDDVCTQLNINESYGNVLIAVTEAINNAIIHGNNNDAEALVSLKSYTNLNQYYFTVEDEGNGFDFSNLPDPTAPENIEKENGRGIFLMNNLADNVEFENNGKKVLIYFNK